MLYFEWCQRFEAGALTSSFLEYVGSRRIPIGPLFFSWAGNHLWFIGFLFAFSLIMLPLLLWLKGAAGQRLIAWLARLCEHRGGSLLFILPLAVVQLAFHPFFPGEQDWADFFFWFTVRLHVEERVGRDGGFAVAAGRAEAVGPGDARVIHHGKEDKKRGVFLSTAAKQDDSLFATREGAAMQRTGLRLLIFRTGKYTAHLHLRCASTQVQVCVGTRAGVPDAEVHSCRHTFAINFLSHREASHRNGGNLRDAERASLVTHHSRP